MADRPALRPIRERLHEIIFEADDTVGKAFDVALLLAILLSVASVMLESVDSIDARHHTTLVAVEWMFTILFTLEYILRVVCVRRPLRYVFSFYGIVDLLSILPTYLSLFVAGTHSLAVIRALRLLRVFRIFKLGRFLNEAGVLRQSLWASRAKITVFLAAVLIVVVIMGTGMYLVEGPENGFDSIPTSMYWAIVTMTTVGYGDITPQTPGGKTIAAAIMILGYSFIIIPTGIISAEFAQRSSRPISTQVCPDCCREGHEASAIHCKFCGGKL